MEGFDVRMDLSLLPLQKEISLFKVQEGQICENENETEQ